MMEFKTPLKAVSVSQIFEPDYVFLCDNLGNVFAIFPRGKYEYRFWEDVVSMLVPAIDLQLHCQTACSGDREKFRQKYFDSFLSRRELEFKKSYEALAELEERMNLLHDSGRH